MESPYANCPECDRLWREYAKAAADLSGAHSRSNAALMTNDIPAFRAIEAEVQEIQRRRTRAATDLLKHQQRAHIREMPTVRHRPSVPPKPLDRDIIKH
jgi:hypothetical protein